MGIAATAAVGEVEDGLKTTHRFDNFDRFLVNHLRNCEYARVACTHGGCSEMLPKRDLESHLSSCVCRPVSCPNECGSIIPFQDVVLHRSTDCPNESMLCPHQQTSNGCASSCEVRYRRESLRMHLDSEEYLRWEINQLKGLVLNEQTISESQVI